MANTKVLYLLRQQEQFFEGPFSKLKIIYRANGFPKLEGYIFDSEGNLLDYAGINDKRSVHDLFNWAATTIGFHSFDEPIITFLEGPFPFHSLPCFDFLEYNIQRYNARRLIETETGSLISKINPKAKLLGDA